MEELNPEPFDRQLKLSENGQTDRQTDGEKIIYIAGEQVLENSVQNYSYFNRPLVLLGRQQF